MSVQLLAGGRTIYGYNERQSSASEQIPNNVEAISNMTNQLASGTQQIARAAEDLNRLTENLQGLITRFKLSNGASGQQAGKNTPGGVAKKPLPKANRAVRENGTLVLHNGEMCACSRRRGTRRDGATIPESICGS